MNRKLLLSFAAICWLAVGATMSAQADTVVPAEWVGIWENQHNTYDCDTNELLFSSAGTDTLCPGAVFTDPGDDELGLVCTSSADGTSYTSHCEASEEMIPGCTVTTTFDTVGTRTGDTSTMTTTFTTVYTGECFGAADTCRRTESTSTRIAGPPSPCEGTANEDQTWGAVKSLYR